LAIASTLQIDEKIYKFKILIKSRLPKEKLNPKALNINELDECFNQTSNLLDLEQGLKEFINFITEVQFIQEAHNYWSWK